MNDARQQAIDAGREALRKNPPPTMWEDADVVVDAIPGDVHAQLAINKGGAPLFAGWVEDAWNDNVGGNRYGVICTDRGIDDPEQLDGQHIIVLRLAGKDPQP